MSFENIIKFYLTKFPSLKPKDIFQLIKIAKVKKLKAHEDYILVGSHARILAFIEKGIIRAHGIKNNGEEVTVWLRWENQFLTSYDDVLYNQQSRFTYTALEDTTLLEVDYDVFMEMINSEPQYIKPKEQIIFEILRDVVTQKESFLLLTPKERYERLIKQQPNIFQRVSSKHIATYLGITPVSLSRIRKRITEK